MEPEYDICPHHRVPGMLETEHLRVLVRLLTGRQSQCVQCTDTMRFYAAEINGGTYYPARKLPLQEWHPIDGH